MHLQFWAVYRHIRRKNRFYFFPPQGCSGNLSFSVSVQFCPLKLQALCIVSTTVTVNSINFMSFSNVKTFNEKDLIQDLNVRFAEWGRCWIWSLNSALVAAITSNDEEWYDGPKAIWTNHWNCFLICFHSTPYNSFHASHARAHTHTH